MVVRVLARIYYWLLTRRGVCSADAPARQRRARFLAQKSWAWLTVRPAATPIFILSYARVGSNLLRDYLNSFPNVYLFDEVLSSGNHFLGDQYNAPPDVKKRYLNDLLRIPAKDFVGCKLKLYQLENHGLRLEDLLNEFPTAKIALVYRKDQLAQFFSYETAKRTRQWTNAPSTETLTVDPDAFRQFCETQKKRYQTASAILKEYCADYQLWSYEELTQKPIEQTASKIAEWLETQPAALQSGLKKQNNLPLSVAIANYTEVAELDCRFLNLDA